VVAVDIQPEMIYRVGQRVRAAGLTNVTVRVADAQELPLPDATVDRAFLISVLDEIPDPARALAELHRILKPNGILSLTAEFLDPDYRFLGETVRQLEPAGFVLVNHFGNIWCYTANFRLVDGDATGRSYYVARQDHLLREFNGVVRRVQPVLMTRYDSQFAEMVAAEARQEYTRLIPQLPYIGGRGNKLTWNLIGTAWFVAFYRAMKAHGRSTEEIGRLLTEMYKVWFDAYPGWLLRLQGWFTFTPLYQRQLERRARQSQERRYPGDWVLTRVLPNGYDFGVDYTECGIVKFCRAQGAAELLPYLCPLDFIMSERMNLGLVRTTTLAQGDSRCNFRFKQGGETQWPAAIAEGGRDVQDDFSPLGWIQTK
jgi:ubiquinone/menaquinone biosynthesis C-methylase UbiE